MECINTILDFMSEDLYKQDKKPYIQVDESEGKSDQDASNEAWNKHIFRNESIICDLFHGQYKSTLICSQCQRVSITFDPFLMTSLPIPSVKHVNVELYYIQYTINDEYKNYRISIKIKETDRIAELRKKIEEQYGFEASSFLITWTIDNKINCIYNNQQYVKDINDRQKGGVTLLFEIPSVLKPSLPPLDLIKKDDSNNGIDPSWVKVCINVLQQTETEKKGKLLNLPRFIYV